MSDVKTILEEIEVRAKAAQTWEIHGGCRENGEPRLYCNGSVPATNERIAVVARNTDVPRLLEALREAIEQRDAWRDDKHYGTRETDEAELAAILRDGT